MLRLVDGDMYFGIHRLVVKGDKIRGKDNFILQPMSEVLKNDSFSLLSCEEPTLPPPEISRISARLKIFLIIREVLNPIPIS